MSAEEMDTSDHEAKHDLKVEAGNSTKVSLSTRLHKLYVLGNEKQFDVWNQA